MIKKNLGGDRLGSGNKMEVTMHGYGKSTHNLSRVRRTSMTIGTLVPMGCWQLLSGDKVKMRLDALITSNALLYQMYGSMKFQVDVFTSRLALYQPKMLLNLNDAGLEVSDIKFPQLEVTAQEIDWSKDPSNQQINPSSALAYLGIRGVGKSETPGDVTRNFCANGKLMYTDCYKEYYANKQEGIGVVIHNTDSGTGVTIEEFYVNSVTAGVPIEIPNVEDQSYETPIDAGDTVVVRWKSNDGITELNVGAPQLTTGGGTVFNNLTPTMADAPTITDLGGGG